MFTQPSSTFKTRRAGGAAVSSKNTQTDDSVSLFLSFTSVLSLMVVTRLLLVHPVTHCSAHDMQMVSVCNAHYYKNVLDFQEDMMVMFNDAGIYNQEGNAGRWERIRCCVYERRTRRLQRLAQCAVRQHTWHDSVLMSRNDYEAAHPTMQLTSQECRKPDRQERRVCDPEA